MHTFGKMHIFSQAAHTTFIGGGIMRNKALDYTALTLAIIGAVNWGLIGFFDFNLVASIFGGMSWISRIIYGLVGLCGLYLISFYMQNNDVRTQS
jgi:uncharacterized membrane protein YuzA (DUF378 family)